MWWEPNENRNLDNNLIPISLSEFKIKCVTAMTIVTIIKYLFLLKHYTHSEGCNVGF